MKYAYRLIEEALEEIKAGETDLAVISLQGALRIMEREMMIPATPTREMEASGK